MGYTSTGTSRSNRKEGWNSCKCQHWRKEDDPVFVITDLLIHLAAKQMEKKASTVVEGEKLDLLIGSRPI